MNASAIKVLRDEKELRTFVVMPDLATEEDDVPEVCLVEFDDFLRIVGLYVPAPLRGRGLARALMTAAVRIAEKIGKPAYLEVAPFAGRPVPPEALFAFYGSLGFRRVPPHPFAMVRD